MSPIDQILSRLVNVRQRQDAQWLAICPSHEDKKPSLSIRETSEGSVLLHCFASCKTQDVLESIGLDPSSLFPPRDLSGREPKRTPRLLTASQALELLGTEAMVVAVTAGNLSKGISLLPHDLKRCQISATRIFWIQDEFMGAKR